MTESTLPLLNADELRILGSLIEKEMTTPDYYPLTLNSLTLACNQKSNRDPVVQMEESQVQDAVDSLRRKGLVMLIQQPGSRAQKFRHALYERHYLEPEELAVLGELMLRGPQTLGELRTRAGRMREFADLEAVERVLTELMEREAPMVMKLERQPGRKEHRFAHLLAGEPAITETADAVDPLFSAGGGTPHPNQLAAEIAELRQEIEELKAEFARFRSQFE